MKQNGTNKKGSARPGILGWLRWALHPRNWASSPWMAGTLALGLAVLVLSLPKVWGENYSLFISPLQQGILAFLALILLSASYVWYQQKILEQVRGKLHEEVAERTRLQSEMESFQQLTMMDPLTGLYNRHFIEQHLAAEVARCERHGYQLNVMKLDLSNFRKINSYYGPAAGDLVLKSISDCLLHSLRHSDVSVRTGSDEFLVLLPESTPERVPHIMARLTGLEVQYLDEKIPVEFTAGWTAYRPGEKPHELLRRVDKELAHDKQTGRAGDAIRRAQSDQRQSQSVEAMGRLAGRVAHDFNNLLSLVKGYSELVLDSMDGKDPVRQYIEQIHDANERASSLTHQLLVFSRGQDLNREDLDLSSVVDHMDAMLQRLVGEEIELVVALQGEPGWIHGNRGQMEQIVLDLAVNARETMPKGGRLTIETSNVELDEDFVHWHPGTRPGRYVMLAVLDTGPGFDAETREHIFEPFFPQKDKSRKNGLGLASVYGIVKQNGGYIWVDSEPGLGTRFSVYLPQVGSPVSIEEPVKESREI